MTRVSSETSLAHISIETAIAPGQKNGVDPSLIGVFDDALRQARRGEVAPAPQPAEPSQEARSTEVRESPSRRTENENRAPNEAAPEDTGTAPVEENATESSDGAESDESGTEPETAADEAVDRAESNEETNPHEEEGDEEDTPDAAVGVEVVVQTVVVEAADSAEASIEADVPIETDEKAAKNTGESSAKGKSDSQTSTPAAELPADEPALDEASTLPETEVEVLEGESGEESELDARTRVEVTEEMDSTQTLDEAKEEREEKKPEAKQVGAEATVTSEESAENTSKSTSKRQEKTNRRERQAVSEQPGNVQPAAAEADRPAPATTTSAPESQTVTAESAAPLPELTGAPPPSAPSPAPQPTGPVEGVSAVESRGSTASSQSEATANTAKGQGHGVDSAKFVQRVANAFAALGQRSGPVRLKLYPPELGSLRMEITVKNGTMSARVEAETAAAKSALLENLPVLRERLAEQGIKVDRFDVGLSDNSQGGASERPDGGDRSFGHTGRNGHSQSDSTKSDLNTSQPQAEATITTDGRLDILI